MSQLFSPIKLRDMTARNRVMMSPMSQARADELGVAQVWHLVHYGSRAVGGVGLLLMEDTAIAEAGRLNERSLGLYDNAQIPAFRQIVEFCRAQHARVGLQLGHAGPKAWGKTQGQGPVPAVSPSGLPFTDGWVTPTELTIQQIERIVEDWRAAALRAMAASFDFVEVHAAHGYLLNAFLSPLTNRRTDVYGKNRTRLLFDVIKAVREAIPSGMPLFTRLSVDDLAPGGCTVTDTERLAARLGEMGVDALDLSWGGITSQQESSTVEERREATRRVRHASGLPVVAVGLVESAIGAEQLVADGIADIAAIGRMLIRNPYWALEAAEELSNGAPPAVVSPYLVGSR